MINVQRDVALGGCMATMRLSNEFIVNMCSRMMQSLHEQLASILLDYIYKNKSLEDICESALKDAGFKLQLADKVGDIIKQAIHNKIDTKIVHVIHKYDADGNRIN